MTKIYAVATELAWIAVAYLAAAILVPVVKKTWRSGRTLIAR